MVQTAVDRLTAILLAAGYPIQCVSDNGDKTYKATLNSTGTPAQVIAVNAFCSTYVDAPRVPLPLNTIIANINALNPAAQNKLIVLAIALAIQQNPSFGATVGVPIVGDQPG